MCPADATVPCAQHVTVAPLLLVYAAGTLPGVNVSILPPANAGGTVVCAVTSEGGVVAGQVSFQDSAPGAYISLQLVVLPGARSGLSVSCASGAQAVTVDIVAAALPCAAGYVPPTSPGGGCQQCAPGTWSWAGLPCQPCPHGAVCRGGTDLEPLPGYWRASNASVVAVPCPVPDACVGGAPGAAGCAAGYASITCNVCAPGYGRSSGACIPCAQSWVVALSLVGALVLITILIALLILKSAVSIGGPSSDYAIIVKVLLNHAQVLGAFASLRINWPDGAVPGLLAAGDSATSPTMQWTQWECVSASLSGFAAAEAAAFAMPLIVLTVLACFVGIRRYRRETATPGDDLLFYCTVALYTLQPFLVRRALGLFDCTDVPDRVVAPAGDGTVTASVASVLTGDYNTGCDARYLVRVALPVGGTLLAAVGAGLPAALAALLRRRPGSSAARFLQSGYVPARHYWELVSMLRKAALVAVALTFSSGTLQQIAAMQGVVLAALALHLACRPLASTRAGELESCALLVQVATLCAAVASDDPSAAAAESGLGWALLVGMFAMNVGVFARGGYLFVHLGGVSFLSRKAAPYASGVVVLARDAARRAFRIAHEEPRQSTEPHGLEIASLAALGDGGGRIVTTNPLFHEQQQQQL
jgi:hypothetical protein